MAFIAPKVIGWTPSSSPNIVEQRIYWKDPSDAAFAYGGDYQAVSPATDSFDLANLADSLGEGEFDFTVVAVEEGGNISDFAGSVRVTVDFTAPAAPTNLHVVG